MKKRKVGRPKKRGPKKKRKYISKKKRIDGRTLVSHKKYFNYKIIQCHNGKKVKQVAKFETSDEAFKYLKKLDEENKAVLFKSEYTAATELSESEDEYLLLEENSSGTKKNSMIKDKYGRYTEVKTNITDWVILDKIPMYKEETFMVFGEPERHNFSWVYENLILTKTKYEIKRVIVYKNKLVIKNDFDDFDIVFCKTIGDCIRLYNMASRKTREEKRKNIFFIGSYSDISDKRRRLENELVKYTGFPKRRIQMSTTSYFSKN